MLCGRFTCQGRTEGSCHAIPKVLEGKDVRNIPNMKADATINMWGIGSYFATKSYIMHGTTFTLHLQRTVKSEKAILLNRVQLVSGIKKIPH